MPPLSHGGIWDSIFGSGSESNTDSSQQQDPKPAPEDDATTQKTEGEPQETKDSKPQEESDNKAEKEEEEKKKEEKRKEDFIKICEAFGLEKADAEKLWDKFQKIEDPAKRAWAIDRFMGTTSDATLKTQLTTEFKNDQTKMKEWINKYADNLLEGKNEFANWNDKFNPLVNNYIRAHPDDLNNYLNETVSKYGDAYQGDRLTLADYLKEKGVFKDDAAKQAYLNGTSQLANRINPNPVTTPNQSNLTPPPQPGNFGGGGGSNGGGGGSPGQGQGGSQGQGQKGSGGQGMPSGGGSNGGGSPAQQAAQAAQDAAKAAQDAAKDAQQAAKDQAYQQQIADLQKQISDLQNQKDKDDTSTDTTDSDDVVKKLDEIAQQLKDQKDEQDQINAAVVAAIQKIVTQLSTGGNSNITKVGDNAYIITGQNGEGDIAIDFTAKKIILPNGEIKTWDTTTTQ